EPEPVAQHFVPRGIGQLRVLERASSEECGGEREQEEEDVEQGRPQRAQRSWSGGRGRKQRLFSGRDWFHRTANPTLRGADPARIAAFPASGGNVQDARASVAFGREGRGGLAGAW